MTKPHEEEWVQDSEYVDVVDGATIMKAWDDGEGGHFARARLASKAPKMARALLEDVKRHARSPEPTHSCVCRKCVLLREAGVLE